MNSLDILTNPKTGLFAKSQMVSPDAMNVPGNMFLFVYDAKTKDKLPYWDKFPLIFVVSIASSSFLGINLHYLPPDLRSKALLGMMRIATNKNLDDNTRLSLSWRAVQALSTYPLVKPCVKKYLKANVVSPLHLVSPSQWNVISALPLENFQKQSAATVWTETRNSIL